MPFTLAVVGLEMNNLLFFGALVVILAGAVMGHCQCQVNDAGKEGAVFTVLNICRYTGISAEIPVFYSKRYDKCKILLDIVLDQHGPIYRHVTDISVGIRDENIRYITT